MEEERKLAKSKADRKVKISIRVSGFPTQRGGMRFIEQIVKPEYHRLFEGSNLHVEGDGDLVFDEYICCSINDEGSHSYVGSETMHYCLYLGPGCPV